MGEKYLPRQTMLLKHGNLFKLFFPCKKYVLKSKRSPEQVGALQNSVCPGRSAELVLGAPEGIAVREDKCSRRASSQNIARIIIIK